MLRQIMSRFGVALQYPEFRRLWMANASSQAASWGLIVTRGWFIYGHSNSSFLVGLSTFAAMGPMLVVPPIVGVLAAAAAREYPGAVDAGDRDQAVEQVRLPHVRTARPLTTLIRAPSSRGSKAKAVSVRGPSL